MNRNLLNVAFLTLTLGLSQTVSAAAANPSADKARSEAEAKGYIFFSSHNEIVAEAKKEGKLRVLSGLSPESIKAVTSAFRQRYPFVDITAQELAGIDALQRVLLELKAGVSKEWDVMTMANDLYNEYPPYFKKFDILRMAGQGVLQIPLKMIDPKNRNIVAMTANIQVGVAYNKNLISHDKTPGTWEDYLKPEFKGKKFLADIRPTEIAALVPAWGLERTLDYARKLAAQEPVWVRGGTRGMAALSAGERLMFIGNNYKTIREAQVKDRTGSLGYRLLEPIPVRMSESLGVIATSRSPHVALLWLEFQTTQEAQKLIDEYEPFGASIHGPGSIQGQEIRGKKLSEVDWDHYTKLSDYQAKVVAAYGFPKAEIKK
ncbi:MAG: hypothetical protein HYY45_05450 [Deltaproteobacteria bacterium]|nr:hypothetical protein [Deltaproteobacteria bacterium]